MTFRPDLLLAHVFPEKRQNYAKRDTILYALGIGLGRNPLDLADLDYLLEDRLRALPTFAVTLGTLGMWITDRQFGVDYGKLVHYEQAATFHAQVPPEADIVSLAHVASVTDRGENRGAIVIIEREISDSVRGTLLCTLRQTLLLRADGGFGGAPPSQVPPRIPNREADVLVSFVTEARAALIYRLSGDWNPLHSDPEVGRRAGFDRPILHGLASYGIAGVAIARACGLKPEQVTSLGCRFTGVVFPGDTLEFKIWREPGGAAFQGFVGDRKTLDQGYVTFRSAT
jgi:acyl dehydratase